VPEGLSHVKEGCRAEPFSFKRVQDAYDHYMALLNNSMSSPKAKLVIGYDLPFL